MGRSRWPDQSWSGCSESQATAPSAAVDLPDERVLPAGADLADAHGAARAVGEAQEDRRGVLGRDLARHGLGGALRRERLDRAGRLVADLDERRQVGHHRRSTRWPVTNGVRSSQCEPMSPTARSAPPRSGWSRQFQSVSMEQPVLEVAAGHEPDVAELAAGDDLVGVLVERVEADVEVDRVDEAGSASRATAARPSLPRSSPAASRRRRACRSRGSPRPARTWRSLGEVTWTTSTRRVREELVERRVRRGHVQGAGARRATLRAAAEDAAHVDADPAQRLDVDGPDEPGADDGGTDVGELAVPGVVMRQAPV